MQLQLGRDSISSQLKDQFLTQKKNHKTNKYLKIFLYQFIGTGIFAYVNLAATNYAYSIPYFAGVQSYLNISVSLFILIFIIGGHTGAHFNPAVTVAFMTRKIKRIDVLSGLVYFVAEITGAFAGAFFVKLIMPIKDVPLTGVDFPTNRILYLFGNQILGTSILVFVIMQSSEPLTSFCLTGIENMIYVPILLIVARQFSYRNNGLNPGFCLAFQVVYSMDTGNWFVWHYIWISTIGPIIGSLIAVAFFEFFYKRFYYHLLIRSEIKDVQQQSRRLVFND